MKTREELIKKFKENNIVDYQLKNEKDLYEIFGIDTEKIDGYSTLSDSNKQLFNKFIVNFLNGLGIDSKIALTPESIFFVEHYEAFAKEFMDESYITLKELMITALDQEGDPKKILIHKIDKEYKDAETTHTNTKQYLRFSYKWKYQGRKPNKEWLHVIAEKEWY